MTSWFPALMTAVLAAMPIAAAAQADAADKARHDAAVAK
jgi:hypothetical protein